jgi:hypothetical protein
MVVRSFYIIGVSVLESEADPVLIVNADRPLTFSISAQLVEPVSGWNLQLFRALNPVELRQLALCPANRLTGNRFGLTPHKEPLGIFVFEALYHGLIMSCAE